MKKSAFWCLLLVCCACLALTGGFFIGRNQNHAVVVVSDAPANSPSGTVNINTADAELLQTLPGIGETLANRIVLYRQSHGDFASVGDLTKVEGISTDTLRDILDYITTGG